MLNISPFSYGLIIQQVYDNGSVYSPEVLDITEASLHARFLEVRCSACIEQFNSLVGYVLVVRNVCKLFLTINLVIFLRVWGTSLACVWRLATPLWPQSPTPSSMATRESWLSLWRQTTPSPWQKRYSHQTNLSHWPLGWFFWIVLHWSPCKEQLMMLGPCC